MNEASWNEPGAGGREFDFWLGEWEVSWEGGEGVNRIERVLGGKVILEQFDGAPSIAMRGMSVSVYHAPTGEWLQTWVDSDGNYLDFRGVFDGERMVLSRRALLEGRAVLQRMVWYDIGENALEWKWERSEDGGWSWRTLWHIHYRRRAARSAPGVLPSMAEHD